MKKILNFSALTAILGIVSMFGSVDTLANTRPTVNRTNANSAAQVYRVERGTSFRVRMNGTINSKSARTSDRFTATLTEPVYSNNGVVVIPVGSTVTGRVDSVTRAQKGGDAGQIGVSFVSVRLPNGTTRSINGSLTDLNTSSAKSDNESIASGDDRKNDKIIFIGGGAGGGAILGGLIGGGRGAAIGAILGGLGGLAGERFTRGEEAEVRSGTEFGVYLNQAISLPRFSERGGTPGNYGNSERSAGGRTYVVRRGDTLGKISQRFYGTTRSYMRIYDANRDRMSSPGSVEVGQELIIP
ncbi:MAG: LysM peptidoglycan-binding domain-containing protein [Acidobacteriota bacterium]|nr:LysM peptidoglycan-binding domain-containing protein [Acidobacteriota bacterium]